jgi:NAD(P)-dependent dehydrogenase (short-subunit alcohol dehydrogenase family)
MIKNKITVVTGSSKGIGKAIALAFAKSEEYAGIVTDARKQGEAQMVSDEIKNIGCDTIAVEADISKEKSQKMVV